MQPEQISPWGKPATPQLLRRTDTGGLYLAHDGRARYVPTMEVLSSYSGELGEAIDVPPGHFDELSFGPDVPPKSAPLGIDSASMRQYVCNRLKGFGLEFGAGPRPMPLPPFTRVKYVDRFDDAEFVELSSAARSLTDARYVHVDVLDDMENMQTVADASLDFIVAAHVIEHVTDPLAVLASASRCLRPGGRLVLVVPDMRRTFDRSRPLTSFDRLLVTHRWPTRERSLDGYFEMCRHVHGFGLPEALEEANRMWEAEEDVHLHTFTPQSFRDISEFAEDWFGFAPTWLHEGEFPTTQPDNNEFYVEMVKAIDIPFDPSTSEA